MARVASIAYTPPDVERRPEDRYARATLGVARLVADHGIDGDAKAKRGKRQINVMLADTIAELAAEGYRTAPGELGEQLVITGIAPEEASPGMRLEVGPTAVIQLGELREPCSRFAAIQGVRAEDAVGRIGFMARVVAGGEIAVGSPVKVASAERLHG